MHMNVLARFLTAAAVCVALAVPCQAADRVITSNPGPINWPLFIAADQGIFDRYGIKLNVEYGQHPVGIAAVANKEAIAAHYGLDTALAAATKGERLVLVGGTANVGNFAVMGRPGWKGRFKGARVAIGRAGDPPYYYMQSLLKSLGEDPQSVTWIGAGPPAQRAIALSKNMADLSIISSPDYYKLQDEGYPVVELLTAHPEVIIATTFVIRRELIAKEREMVLNFLRAYIEGIAIFYKDRLAAKKAMTRFMPMENEAYADRLYDEYVKWQDFERVPYVLKAAVDASLDRGDDPALKTANISSVVANDLIDQLVKEGFFVKVFGPEIEAEVQKKSAAAMR
jgi:ABC-type nitrate/sulfonate/bicarbonate transport system substrate-binding protein